jgi:predicted ATPase
MLKAAPQIAILATSREPLRAEGEWLLRLPPLEVPPDTSGMTAAEVLSFPAVELFNERATATVDSFVLADVDLPVVLEICRRLDGVRRQSSWRRRGSMRSGSRILPRDSMTALRC